MTKCFLGNFTILKAPVIHRAPSSDAMSNFQNARLSVCLGWEAGDPDQSQISKN